MLGKLIYLTGAPAAGKSTVASLLENGKSNIIRVDFGSLLLKATETALHLDYEELRQKSAKVITPADVKRVDEALIAYIQESRNHSHILLDSHAVTKEAFGFRATSFSAKQLDQLEIDVVFVLFCAAEETVRRIKENPGGRPLISEAQALHHRTLQDAVAVNYSIISGCPLYFVETNKPSEEIAASIATLCSSTGIELLNRGA